MAGSSSTASKPPGCSRSTSCSAAISACGGFGFSVNGTIIDQKGSGPAPAIAVGVAPHTYNATFYYENHGISARLSTTWAEGSQSLGSQPERHPQRRLVQRRLSAVGFLLEPRSFDHIRLGPPAAADLRRGQHLQGGAAFLLPVRECRVHLLPAGTDDPGRPARPLLTLSAPLPALERRYPKGCAAPFVLT